MCSFLWYHLINQMNGREDLNVQNYFEYINAPWGRLFYELVWHNLEFVGKSVLDFGSGFGVTADKLAERNDVVAIEPNGQLLLNRKQNNQYTQLCGSMDVLKGLCSNSFDVVICHNVLEYVVERAEIINEFYRILKPGGLLSIVKHNKYGKIMQKAVFEYNAEQALKLLKGENIESPNFGQINEYSLDDLAEYCDNRFSVKNIYGIRTFYGLQNNDIKFSENWLENMFKLECAAENIDEFKNIAFFHHVLLEKLV